MLAKLRTLWRLLGRIQGLSSLLVCPGFLGLWPHLLSLLPSLYGLLLCVLSSSASFNDTVIGFRTNLGNPGYHFKIFSIIVSAKTPLLNKVAFLGKDVDISFVGHNSTHIT